MCVRDPAAATAGAAPAPSTSAAVPTARGPRGASPAEERPGWLPSRAAERRTGAGGRAGGRTGARTGELAAGLAGLLSRWAGGAGRGGVRGAAPRGGRGAIGSDGLRRRGAAAACRAPRGVRGGAPVAGNGGDLPLGAGSTGRREGGTPGLCCGGGAGGRCGLGRGTRGGATPGRAERCTLRAVQAPRVVVGGREGAAPPRDGRCASGPQSGGWTTGPRAAGRRSRVACGPRWVGGAVLARVSQAGAKLRLSVSRSAKSQRERSRPSAPLSPLLTGGSRPCWTGAVGRRRTCRFKGDRESSPRVIAFIAGEMEIFSLTGCELIF